MPKWLKLFIPVFMGLIIYQIPSPDGVMQQGWNLFAIFVATIIGVVLKPFLMGVVALLGLSVAVATKTLDIAKEGLTGYSTHIIWLITYVFFIARGFIKSGLGARIAYFFVKLLGRRTLGLGYGIVVTELIIGPAIPSNSARAGGIMFPILKGISESLGSKAGDGTERQLGSFLTQVCFHGNLIVSAMFLTAMAANPMAQVFAAKQGIEITWVSWFQAASVPGLVSLILVPIILYFIYPPHLKRLPPAPEMAREKLKEMGAMTMQEWTMAGTFVFMLVLWVFGAQLDINATSAALWGVSILLLSGVLTWDDVLNEKEAWHNFIWFAILITMAKYLEEFGLVAWFSNHVGHLVHGLPWMYSFIILILIYFYSHYFFASNTAHVGAMYSAFLAVSIASGTPPLLAALVLGFCGSLFSHMTHYGSSSAVVLYGTGYVPITAWWSIGFVVSVANILIWGLVGGMWWKYLGIW
ncbi:MAG: anion permease [Alphaproteobacteria bacterium]